jgi:hypothetical protein
MNKEAIERSLLDVDGSCRDINFSEHIAATGAASLLNSIGAHWDLTQAINAEGEPVPPEDFRSFLAKERGTLSTLWKGSVSPHHLQAFFHWTEPDQVFCELTFFPQDLDAERFTLDSFLRILAIWVNAARSQEYYVRFEDGSWRHGGQTGKRSVIFSHESVPLPQTSSYC